MKGNKLYSSDMSVSRHLKFGHHWKHLSLNQFIFLISILTVVHEILADSESLGTTTSNGTTAGSGIACAERWTCTSCTEGTTPSCSWSVAEQTCADSVAAAAQSRLVVTGGPSCPKFSVEKLETTANDNTIKVTVTVSDGGVGGSFVDLLANSSVKCRLDKKLSAAQVEGNRISCTSARVTSQYKLKCWRFEPIISHLLILFDDKFLRFDNENDHYVTTYPSDCPAINCSHCHWNDGTRRSYCVRCLDDKRATASSPFQYCDARSNSDFAKLSSANARIDETCSAVGPAVVKYSVTPKTIVRPHQPESEGAADNANSSPTVPTVDDGQTFGGIVSGGTTFVVHGRRFGFLLNVNACVLNKTACGFCYVQNDTLMDCRSPKIVINDQQPQSAIEIQPLTFYALNHYGNEVKFESKIKYRLYHDPVFTDFVVNGCCNVTVNGLYLGQGYAAKDLSILPDAENSSSRCLVTWTDSTQITCQLSQSSLSQLDQLPKQININLGNYNSVVNITKQKTSHFRSSLSGILPGVVITISAYVSFIAVLCVALIFFKSSKDYDLLHLHGRQQLAEMRPLNEKNDYDKNSESKIILPICDEY